ncbi:MAG: HEAT repeat domain-containing protein [Planctomycetes bacterium]|nr:HEAT repeat domain-containing protein [Planctomycetota bacterium]
MDVRSMVVVFMTWVCAALGQTQLDSGPVFAVLRPEAKAAAVSSRQQADALAALELRDLHAAWRGVMPLGADPEHERFATPLSTTERKAVLTAARSKSPETQLAFFESLGLGDVPIADRVGALQFLDALELSNGVELAIRVLRETEARYLVGGSVADASQRSLVSMLRRCPQDCRFLPPPAPDQAPEFTAFLIRVLGASRMVPAFAMLAQWIGTGHDQPILDQLAGFGRIQAAALRSEALEKVRGCLEASDWKTRRGAIVVASRQHDSGSFRDLVRCLDDDNPRVRRAGLEALTAMSGERLGPDPLRWLDWADARERWLVEDWPDLEDALGDQLPDVVMEQLNALTRERLFRDEVTHGIAWLLQSPDQGVRIVTSRTLGLLRGSGAAVHLVPLLGDAVEPVRVAAHRALESIAGCDLPRDPEACGRKLSAMGLR